MNIKIIALLVTGGIRDLKKSINSIKKQSEPVDKIIIASESAINAPYEIHINPYQNGLARNTMQALTKIFIKYGANVFIATLDDDDQWKEHYIKEVKKKIQNGFNFIATQLLVKKENKTIDIYKPSNIKMNDFLYGNPGIHGSNKVFKLNIALEAGGMPKHINAATDRAFNINLLRHPEIKFCIIKKPLVIYNKDVSRSRITNDPKRIVELQAFYKHFWNHIDESQKNQINKRHETLHQLRDVISW